MDSPFAIRCSRKWTISRMIALVTLAVVVALFPEGTRLLLKRGTLLAMWAPFDGTMYLIIGAFVAFLIRASRTPSSPGEDRWDWKRSLVLGLALFVIYRTYGKTYNFNDTIPAAYMPVALIRGDGPYLDRFDFDPDEPTSYFVIRSRGHLVSCYPLGPPLLAVPLMLPQVALWDWLHPGWDRMGNPRWMIESMSRNVTATLAALTGVALLHLLRGLGLGRMALLTTLSAALASNLWNEAARSLWQHGPAALMLTLSLLLLVHHPVPRWRVALAGLTTALLPICRPIDIVFATTVFLWMAWYRPRDLIPFLPAPILLGAALIAYNYWFFGAITGGNYRIEGGLGPWDVWTSGFREGAAGTLLSPSRGLFIYTPWVAVALATTPAIVGRLRPGSLVRWLLASLVPYFLLLATYRFWWAGICFGPRYWTDAMPLFAILLGFGLDWSRTRLRPVFWIFAATILFSLVVQLVGAAGYPSTWGLQGNVQARLWDWRDNELFQCWRDKSFRAFRVE